MVNTDWLNAAFLGGHCLSSEISPWPIEMDTGALTVVNTPGSQHCLAKRCLHRGHCLNFELSPGPIETDTGVLTVVTTGWLNTAFIGGNG